MLEKELQALIYQQLRHGNFCYLIQGIRTYEKDSKVDHYADDSFSTKSILKSRYAESVCSIYKRLEIAEYEIIGKENPKNISLNREERLYPDFLLHDYERNFYVFELKVGTKTEREAITEVFAYIFELKNHLPHINNREISIVIISENFGTLLSHAVLQLISLLNEAALRQKKQIACLINSLPTPVGLIGVHCYEHTRSSSFRVFICNLYYRIKTARQE